MIILKLLEIAPFIRYSMHNNMLLREGTYTCQDNRLFYIKSGIGEITINGETYPLRPDMLLLWQCGTTYKFSFEKALPLISINFDYTPERSHHKEYFQTILCCKENATQINNIKQIDFEDCSCLNTPIVLQSASSLLPLLEAIIAQKHEQQFFADSKSSALLKSCIVDIVKIHSVSTLTSNTNQKINTVLKYIDKNYAKNITNESIAKLVNYHPYYLNRLMIATTGSTLHQYIINHRIAVAENLLTATNATISDIADKVGFSSSLVFISNFKKRKGLTPTEFRKKMRSFI